MAEILFTLFCVGNKSDRKEESKDLYSEKSETYVSLIDQQTNTHKTMKSSQNKTKKE